MAQEIVELNRIRLDENLSVPRLARSIGVERSTLHRLLFTPGREPRDRTLYKIQQYLERRKDGAGREPRRDDGPRVRKPRKRRVS